MIYYYNFADFQKIPANVREMIENIFFVMNDCWDYEDKEATEKMIRIFKKPDDVLADLMAILDVFVDKELPGWRIPNNPEKLLLEFVDEVDSHDMVWAGMSDIRCELEQKMKVLALFVLKMAVYRFCKIYFPQTIEKSLQFDMIEKNSIDSVKREMKKWEKQMWKDIDDRFFHREDIFKKRKTLKQKYKFSLLWFECSDCKDIQECIERAFEDIETVEAVKKMQNNPREKYQHLDGFHVEIGDTMMEIQNMKQLLDIMEREIQGKQTEQDSILLRENAERWGKDIQKLLQMLDKR